MLAQWQHCVLGSALRRESREGTRGEGEREGGQTDKSPLQCRQNSEGGSFRLGGAEEPAGTSVGHLPLRL